MRRDRSHLRQVIGPDERAALLEATHHERALILLIVLGAEAIVPLEFWNALAEAVTPVNNKRPDAAALMKRSCGLPVLDDFPSGVNTCADSSGVLHFVTARTGDACGESPLRPAASP